MSVRLKNNVSGFLANAISATDTLLVLQSGQGALFPSLPSGQYFYVTLVSTAGATEIIKVTARSGDSLTGVRAQDGTLAMAFPALSRVEMRINAQTIYDVIDDAITGTSLAVSNIASVIAVAGSIESVNSVAANMPDVNNVSANILSVNVVKNNINNVNAVGSNIADVDTVAANIADINTVADDIGVVGENLEDIVAVGGSITSVVNVSTNMTSVNTTAANISNVNTVAANIVDVSNFGDVYYGAKTSDPSVRNDGTPRLPGDLYFNTTVGRMRVYNGSVWVDYEADAEAAQLAAEAARDAAQLAKTNAETAETNAETAEANAELAETNAETAATNALNAQNAATSAKVAAEAARDAAQLAGDVYVSTAAGLAATTNGQYFSVPSAKNAEFLILYRNNSGSATEIKQYPSVAGATDPARLNPGVFFHDPYYEATPTGEYLYFKPRNFQGRTTAIYARGGTTPYNQWTYQKLKDDLLAQSPALPVPSIEVGVTSPLGEPDCIKLSPTFYLYFNPTTSTFYAGAREINKTGWLTMIAWNHGSGTGTGAVEICCEQPKIINAVLSRRLSNVKTEVDWPLRLTPGFFFNQPYYEWGGDYNGNGVLYFKPTEYQGVGGDVFFSRGGFYSDRSYNLTKLLADLSAAPDPLVTLNATSPLGVTGCIALGPRAALWFDPTTNTFSAGFRTTTRANTKLKMIENNAGVGIGEGIERDIALAQSISRANVSNFYTKAQVDDPLRATLGVFFNAPKYEWVNAGTGSAVLYLQPTVFAADRVFYIRGGFYPDANFTYAQIKASIGTPPDGTVVMGATSPGGLTDCIQFNGGGCLWFNPTTGQFSVGVRTRKSGWLKMIEVNYDGYPGDCYERAVMIQALLQQRIDNITPGPTPSGATYIDPQPEIAGFNISAHRGTTAWGAPEDTIDSAQHAALAGYKYVENDVVYTSDNVFVVMHDDTINRTMENIDGTPIATSVATASTSYATLVANYRMKSSDPRYRRPIPTFDEWLYTVKMGGAYPYFELKATGMPSTLDDALIALVRKHFRDDQVTMISFSDSLNNRIATKCGWRIGYLSGNQTAAAAIANGFVNPNSGSVNTSYMATAAALQLDVGCWTVNSHSEMNRVMKLGVRDITTDNIAPNHPARGRPLGAASSGTTFPSFVTSGAVVIANSQASLAQNASITTPIMDTSLYGAVYGYVSVAGTGTFELLLGDSVIESIPMSGSGFSDYSIARLVHSASGAKLRVSTSDPAGVVVRFMRGNTKQLINLA